MSNKELVYHLRRHIDNISDDSAKLHAIAGYIKAGKDISPAMHRHLGNILQQNKRVSTITDVHLAKWVKELEIEVTQEGNSAKTSNG